MKECVHRTRMPPLPDKLNRTIAPKMGKVVKTEIGLCFSIQVHDLVYQFEMIYLKRNFSYWEKPTAGRTDVRTWVKNITPSVPNSGDIKRFIKITDKACLNEHVGILKIFKVTRFNFLVLVRLVKVHWPIYDNKKQRIIVLLLIFTTFYFYLDVCLAYYISVRQLNT